MCAPVSPSSPARPRAPRLFAAAGVLLMLVGALAWHAAVGPEDAVESSSGGEAATTRAQRVDATLTALDTAWAARDRPAFLDAAGDMPGAAQWAGRTYAALKLLGVGDVRLDFAGDRIPGALGADRTFTAAVDVSWQLHGYRTATSTVLLSFGDDPDDPDALGDDRGDPADPGATISVLGLAAGAESVSAGSALPLWLAGALVAQPGARCVGVDVDPDSIRCERRTHVAQRDVRALLPARARQDDWRVVLPESSAMASALLGKGADGLANTAAVTTTVDASGLMRAPHVVILNPDVMSALRPAAAQLVLSHEAAHAATGAAAVDVPVWVAEGFADYVALRAGRVPVQRAASDVLATVRREGPPRRLPTGDDFTGEQGQPGQAYEAAWLVFQLLGDRYGDAAVVSFYEAVLAGDSVASALAAHVELNRAGLISAWRSHLVRLAG